MIKKKKLVTKTTNGWVKVRRQKPGMIAGLHIPETSQEGKSSWFMDQDYEDFKEGDELMLRPETWFIKINHDFSECDRFLVKAEDLVAVIVDG